MSARQRKPGKTATAAKPSGARNVGRPKAAPRFDVVTRPGRKPMYYVFHGTHQESTGTSDPKEALLYFVSYCARTDPDVGQAEPKLVTIGTIFERARETSMEIGGGERAKTFERADRMLCSFWGGLLLSDIDADSCDRYWATRENLRTPGTRVSAQTARAELTRLRTVVTLYCKANGIAFVPLVVTPRRGTPRVRWLWRDEVARLIRAARGRVWDHERGDWRRDAAGRLVLRDAKFRARARPLIRVILIGAFTGTRVGAIVKAGWRRSATRGHIAVTKANFHRRGWREPESNKRRPTARLCPELLRLVIRWEKADAARGIADLIHDDGGGTVAMSTLQKLFAELRTDAGLGRDVTIHTLRHTCATWLLSGGASLEETAAYLGLSVNELERTYAQVDPIFTIAAADALNEWGRLVRPEPEADPTPDADADDASLPDTAAPDAEP